MSIPLSMRRYAALKIDGVPDGESVYFCEKCDYQLPHGAAGRNACPKGHGPLRYVTVDNDFRRFKSLVEVHDDPDSEVWEAKFAQTMHSLAQRRAALPESVQECITTQLKDMAPAIKKITEGVLRDEAFNRRMRDLYARMTGAMVEVAEKAVENKNRIITFQ